MGSISTELFFNEAEFRIIIPNYNNEGNDKEDPLSILDANPREFAFYDEQLQVYLFACIPKHVAGDGEEVKKAINSFYCQLEVAFDATFLDTSSQYYNGSSNIIPTLNRSSSIRTQSSLSTSPKLGSNLNHQRRAAAEITTPFFTQAYNRNNKNAELMLFEYDDSFCCLYPVIVPIVYAKTKSTTPFLSINSNIQYRPIPLKRANTQEDQLTTTDDSEYDTDLFDTINLLSGLADDPVFSDQERPLQRFIFESHSKHPTGSSSSLTSGNNINAGSTQLSMKRSIRENLPIRSGLVVKIRTTNASVADKMVMMSVELENPAEVGCEFLLDQVEVQVSNAIVTMSFNDQSSETLFPILLNKSDLLVFVYDITLLEDGSAKPPTQPQRIFHSRRLPPQQQQQHANYSNEDKIQPQRVSIQIVGYPLIEGKKGLPMRSKWNTMLDVSSIRQQKKEEISAPFVSEKFNTISSVTSLSPTVMSPSMARSQSNNIFSPGARSIVGSPGGGNQMNHSLEGVFGMKKQGGISMIGRRAPEREIADGIIVSFTVPDTIVVGKTFPLHIFIVNKSKHTRRFQVMIPNRRRHPTESYGQTLKTTLPPLPMEQMPIDPYMDVSEFLKQYFENETHEADIICLENNIRLSPLGPSTSQSVDIQFIAVKDKLHTIDLVQLVDQDTGFVTNLRHVLEVYVEQQQL
ncbi:TRAPP trafficking subunit Trs65-domain-containing protein [Cokeromyces recurvatus]|uniref:TRAPP trafficking subunit Trs65-domain-containing protein n=1 Tax=Cokeromyces recurvatus TaxID=90255 RepID=UPI00221FDD6E|nr:TRAPP trafficking subunit Trs65-domain-containing protein [Cokeromyces recurvatus]KAI7898369.1 TRAPP trafficking subunit Trs65-domain-containing protein [Cokeromyces recurvatus]